MFNRILTVALLGISSLCLTAAKPNIILVMADDQGWGQTGYRNHLALKTPNLDDMAANGLRFERFYAGGPVCSPTRATVLTGRTHDRTGVFDHGYALRNQEKTLAKAMKNAGYSTGHFGKWHLNGLRGPGAPIFKEDTHNPGNFGFDEWLSVTNFFDRNPIMSRKGEIEEHSGDSSEIIVDEALKFIKAKAAKKKPFFAVIWYGTPHDPWLADNEDKKAFTKLSPKAKEHYGELVAMDRSIGNLREGLKKLKVYNDTLVWFTSDNGGLPRFDPPTTGGLRGFKGSMYEGGLRVPALIEWPAGIQNPRITDYPAGAVDIFPTLAKVAGLKNSAMLKPQDGQSLLKLFSQEIGPRKKPLPFRSRGRLAIVDNDYKMISRPSSGKPKYELYNLKKDSAEQNNIFNKEQMTANKLIKKLITINTSITASVKGRDYSEKKVNEQPPRIFWWESELYRPYLSEWINRPEYTSRLKRFLNSQQKNKQP
ncbi:MAG: N-acetylgalactosamine 6-sulfate sulfatase [Limisphaerales bacterium]|nr:MAG: N-acetylgalactosamine 6-sulfate sulfatase [Limisphaerales bacterium]